MKTETRQRFDVVTSNTANGFKEELERRLEELTNCDNVKVSFNLGEGHCAYILYQETRQVPENIIDEYELKGIVLRCYECPYLNYNREDLTEEEKMIKPYGCVNKNRTTFGHVACEYFYEQYDKGNCIPV